MQNKQLGGWQKKIWIYGALFVFFLLWNWNGLIFDLWTGFDMGVQNMELFTAMSSSLSYGKDLLATPYPPLSWIYKGVVPALTASHDKAIFQVLSINLLSAFLRTIIVALFWENANQKTSKILAMIVSSMVLLEFGVTRGTVLVDLMIMLSAMLICRLHIRLCHDCSGKNLYGRKTSCALTAAVGVLISIPQLVKFSYFAAALAFIVILGTILIVRRRWTEIACFVGAYFISTAGLWMLCGEPLRYLPSYVYAMLHFVSGYSEVMALSFSAYEGAFADFLFALFICAVYGLTLVALFIKNRIQATAWFIAAPVLFLTFKEAFVRSDQHTQYFATGVVFVICYLLFVIKEFTEMGEGCVENLFFLSRRFWGVVLLLFVLQDVSSGKWKTASTIYNDFNMIGSEDKYTEKINQSKDNLKMNPEYAMLYQDIETYTKKSLGMLSGEQSFFLAYDLMDRFRMNPIISLWENLTSYSETAAASQYYGENAPDILLYRPEPLDENYFIFHMGTILQAFIENYHVEKVDDNGYLILSHNSEARQEAVTLAEGIHAFVDVPIKIPKIDNAFVFMKVNWELTPLGKLASLVLKPTQTRVEITMEDGTTQEHRFYRTLSENGIYVSSYIENSQELSDLISGQIERNPIASVMLQGNKLFYEQDFDVSFYSVPFSTQQVDSDEKYAELQIEFQNPVLPGHYQVFYAQDGAFNEGQSYSIEIGEGQNNVIVKIPANGWNTLRLDFPNQTAQYDIISINCGGKAADIDGWNDAAVVPAETGWHISAGNYDPFVTLQLVNE